MTANSAHPVLIIDDEGSVLNLVALLLKREGFSVLTSDSAMTAIKLLDERFSASGEPGVSCILCDWKMPGWDGLRFLTELRARPYGPGVPFILMSGAVSPLELEEAAAESADGILIKPIDQKTLFEKVRKTIGLRRP